MRSHLTAIVLCAWSGVATAQTAGNGPATVDLAAQADVIGDVASKVKSAIVFRPNLVISGDYQATTAVVGAKEIIFKPGARIVFNDSTPNTAGAFFVVADKITVEDPSKPGVITWVRSTPSAPPDRGQAHPGGPGAGDGAPGGNGAEGAPGTSGAQGQSSPAITVFVRTIANGGLVIDAVGGAGGPGGTGQAGGQGGPGAQGSHARQARHEIAFGAKIWDPWCEAGPGTGGAGGRGGAGGSGGLGGTGGAGGNATIVSLPQNIPTLFQVIRVNQGGGSGGPGGAGGSGGAGGPGGPEGQLANFCNSAGRGGSAGPTGPQGPAGQNGEPGRAGQPFVAQLDDKQFAALFGF